MRLAFEGPNSLPAARRYLTLKSSFRSSSKVRKDLRRPEVTCKSKRHCSCESSSKKICLPLCIWLFLETRPTERTEQGSCNIVEAARHHMTNTRSFGYLSGGWAELWVGLGVWVVLWFLFAQCSCSHSGYFGFYFSFFLCVLAQKSDRLSRGLGNWHLPLPSWVSAHGLPFQLPVLCLSPLSSGWKAEEGEIPKFTVSVLEYRRRRNGALQRRHLVWLRCRPLCLLQYKTAKPTKKTQEKAELCKCKMLQWLNSLQSPRQFCLSTCRHQRTIWQRLLDYSWWNTSRWSLGIPLAPMQLTVDTWNPMVQL